MTPLTRIRQLIALSASDSTNEARNAAFQACRLIRENGFEVVERRGSTADDPFAQAARAARDGSAYGDPFAGVDHRGGPRWYDAPGQSQAARNVAEEIADMFRRDARQAARDGAEYGAKKARGEPPKPKLFGLMLTATCRSRCQHCGEWTESKVFVAVNGNIYHPECVDRSGA